MNIKEKNNVIDKKHYIHYYTLFFLLISNRNIICRYRIKINTKIMQITEMSLNNPLIVYCCYNKK